jgi:RNA 3'-phosphate cyclase
MGLNASLTVKKYGYYPKGMGHVTMTVEPSKPLRPILLESFGRLKPVEGISTCTFLADRKVAERQAKAAREYLSRRGTVVSDIQVVNDQSNALQKGSSLVLWAETDSGATLGADAIGQLGKPSESVGEEAAEKLQSEVAAKATVDLHLADMLIPYMALAKGRSAYLTRALSEHLETNIWLAEELLNVRFTVEKKDQLYRVEKAS